MNKLRIGLIGSGYMAKTHSLAFRNLGGFDWPKTPRLELLRVVDQRAEAAAEAAQRWGWAEHGTDWRQVTRAADIDVVDIITPNDSHAEIAIDAMQHGKHVMCEKPLSNAIDAARAMVDAARASGRTAIANYVYRCWPAIEQAHKMIREGRLGHLRHFEGHFFQDYARNPALPWGWRFSKALAGGGAFGDIGSHITDIARYLMGDVRRVAALARRFQHQRPGADGTSRPVDVDDLTATLVEFDSGATGAIHASWAATGHKSDLGFTVIGSDGALKFTWERNNELQYYAASDPEETCGFRTVILGGVHPGADLFWYAPGQGLGYGETFVLTVRRLIRAIVAGEPPSPSFLDGLRCLEIVDAVNRAAATGSWVSVERYQA